MKKTVVMLVALLLVFTVFPVSVFADEPIAEECIVEQEHYVDEDSASAIVPLSIFCCTPYYQLTWMVS